MSFRVARFVGLVTRIAGRLRPFAPLLGSESTRIGRRLDVYGRESTRIEHRLAIYGRWPRRIP